jgi:hypothetical protein
LFAFLPGQARALVTAGALEFAGSKAVAQEFKPDWAALLRDLEPTTRKLERIFLR